MDAELTPAANDSAAIAGGCARKLLELRAHNRETQRQLAHRLGMTELMISRLEEIERLLPALAGHTTA